MRGVETVESIPFNAAPEIFAVVRVHESDSETERTLINATLRQPVSCSFGNLTVVAIAIAVDANNVGLGQTFKAVFLQVIRYRITARKIRIRQMPFAHIGRVVTRVAQNLSVRREFALERWSRRSKSAGTFARLQHPCLMRIQTSDDCSATRTTRDARRIVVSEFHAVLPQLIHIRHECCEVFGGGIDSRREHTGEASFISDDEQDVGLTVAVAHSRRRRR